MYMLLSCRYKCYINNNNNLFVIILFYLSYILLLYYFIFYYFNYLPNKEFQCLYTAPHNISDKVKKRNGIREGDVGIWK
jgi:hypothetical protein